MAFSPRLISDLLTGSPLPLANTLPWLLHTHVCAGHTRGYRRSMEKVVSIADVRTFETRSGSVRYVVRDGAGNEYTTFRERIGEAARALEGRRVQIECHEEQRGEDTNVYPDKVEPAPASEDDGGDTDPSEAAWRTAVDAAPWLVGESEPHEAVPPDELYEKLKPFKEKVAEDIEDDAD